MGNGSYPCAGTERPMKEPEVTRRAAYGRLTVREGGEGQGGRDLTSSQE